MKLIRTEFQNFRLLRDLELEFSTDNTKKLTVIRAENETGKTTVMNGIQWALYGDDALPGKGRGFRLHPIDWPDAGGERVPIAVQVDFETTTRRDALRGRSINTTRQYRIIRAAYETLDGSEYRRTPSTVQLFDLTDRGSEPLPSPEVYIREELPLELREVFFTDGDRALSFIEASSSISDKRKLVKQAIRSLLGLAVIEGALKHVAKTASKVNSAARDIGADDRLEEIVVHLENVERESDELAFQIEDAKTQFAAFDQKLSEIRTEIEAALVKGNREELKRDIVQAERQLKNVRAQLAEADIEHSRLFRSPSLSKDLLSLILESSLGKLNLLRDQGKIPSTTIPVLADRLESSTCICGESLELHSIDGKRRREHIQCLIDESKKADALQLSITDLYYGSLSLNVNDEPWVTLFDRIADRRDELMLKQNEQEKQLKQLEIQLDEIPNIDIQGLRATERDYKNQRDRFNVDAIRYETQLDALKKEAERLAAQRDNLLRQQSKGARIIAKLEVVSDVKQLLENSYDRIVNKELTKVSELMNNIFLEMIGADPEQGAIIQKAKISKDFDILVYGVNNRTLNPDRDLNGASRRALTLAFILALTKVSEVEAPNVIDTPLGMMSGYVKEFVLRTVIRESSQLVLFLTRSEIADCEEILDAEAGRVITLTNSAHYPRMLVNDPQVRERKVLRCECDHREQCTLCNRQMDVKSETE